MNEPLPVPTVSELKRLFLERSIRPSRVRGQNFLIDANIMQFVVDSAEVDARDVILEPGPGTGGLTGLLASRAAEVVAVEVDKKLFELASARLSPLKNVRLFHADIMGEREQVNLEVHEYIASALRAKPERRLKVVSNLPYIVSTAFITSMFSHEPLPERMIVMVQREVADRLTAKPGTESYGYLSVIAQAVSRVQPLRHVPPGAFWPPPEVDSKIIKIVPGGNLEPKMYARLRQVAGVLFQHRRKQLGKSMTMGGLAAGRDEARGLLEKIGALENARCEQLSVEQFIQLAMVLS